MAEFIPTGIGGLSVKGLASKPIKKQPSKHYEREELLPPSRPTVNFIPTQDAIDALIARALAALARGMYWDRGSIINLVL